MTSCMRCQGFLTWEQIDQGLEQWEAGGWRCINCGDLFDPLVLEHRAHGQTVSYRRQRRWAAESKT